MDNIRSCMPSSSAQEDGVELSEACHPALEGGRKKGGREKEGGKQKRRKEGGRKKEREQCRQTDWERQKEGEREGERKREERREERREGGREGREEGDGGKRDRRNQRGRSGW